MFQRFVRQFSYKIRFIIYIYFVIDANYKNSWIVVSFKIFYWLIQKQVTRCFFKNLVTDFHFWCTNYYCLFVKYIEIVLFKVTRDLYFLKKARWKSEGFCKVIYQNSSHWQTFGEVATSKCFKDLYIIFAIK